MTLTTVITHATGDVLPASDWNTYLRDNLNWLIQAGANLSSAGTITPTNEFHIVTGTTSVNTLSPATPVVGQQVRLLFQSACPVDGHTGNIRLATGDRTTFANEVIELTYDGANWREMGGKGPVSLGSKTAAVSTTGTTFAAGADLLASPLTFYADGAGTYLVTAAAPQWSNSTAPSANELMLNLDAANAGIMSQSNFPSGSPGLAVYGLALITPAAGTHTVNARLVCSSGGGTSTVTAGAGGSGNYEPAVVRIERIS